jgi:CD2 antigen cytoplasmic tail-binding protein 2
MSSKSVRFASSTGSNSAKRPRDDTSSNDNNENGSEENPKRFRPNEDELDDIDDWRKDEEDGDIVPSERELLEAKRQRRRQWAAGMDEGSTHIDESTSLAAEGIQIEPFHMRREESDGAGYFDGETYVWRKNGPNEQPDAWLDSLNDESETATNKLAPSSALVSKIEEKENSRSLDNLTKEQLYMKVFPLISDTETVAQAVRRYGAVAKQNQKRKKAGEAASEEAYKLAKTCLDDLTGSANALLLKGEVDIYDTRRQRILSFVPTLQEKKQLPTEKQPPAKWEYMGNQDGKIHGPFTTEQMMGWMQAGYFVGLQKVKIRTIREKELSAEDDLMADLMDNDADENKKESNLEKGEWQWSDDINMKTYLP